MTEVIVILLLHCGVPVTVFQATSAPGQPTSVMYFPLDRADPKKLPALIHGLKEKGAKVETWHAERQSGKPCPVSA